MATKDYYEDYWSSTGAQYRGRSTPDYERLLGELVTPSTNCLDVGCGDGGRSGILLDRCGARYVGVDISRRAVLAARALGLDARVIRDATSLPFDDETFDLVVCIEVLEHLFEPQRATAEMARVLCHGGMLIVQVPNVVHWWHRLVFALKGRFVPFGDAIDEPWRDPHIRFFTFSSLQRMLWQQGLEPRRIDGEGANLLVDLPGLRRLARSDAPGVLSRQLTSRYPTMFAKRARIIARKR